MFEVKFLVNLVRCTAVVSHRRFQQKLVTQHFPAFVRCFSVINNSCWGNDERSSLFKNLEVSSPSKVAGTEIEDIPGPLQSSVPEQGELFDRQTESGAPVFVTKATAVAQHAELKAWQNILEGSFDRAMLTDLLIRHFFFDNSFTSFDGFSGQLDFGPMGCSMKDNMLEEWKKSFILQEQMQNVEYTIFTPERVFGDRYTYHQDELIELVVVDEKTRHYFQVNHLIKAHLEKVIADKNTTAEVHLECENIVRKLDGMTKDEMGAVLRRFKIKSPINGNILTRLHEHDLKYSADVAVTGFLPGDLNPDLALGIFVNFKRLFESNRFKLPFAAAQMGKCFRHDISPGSGLIRYREFNTAVFEHFCEPNDKSHPKIDQVRDVRVWLYSSSNKMDGKAAEYKTIGEAVDERIIANETLAYYMARIQMYLVKMGVDPKKLRFRQHMDKEMAPFACDCWHAECLTSYGWIECVRCADRSDYDLPWYTKATGLSLVPTRPLPEPKTVDVVRLELQKDAVDNVFKKEAKDIMEHLAKMDAMAVEAAEESLKAKGLFYVEVNATSYRLTPDMVQFKRWQETRHVEDFFPNVTEGSFDIDRIMYAILEQNFRVRSDDDQKTYFSLPPIIAPLKCSVLPLSSKPEFTPIVSQILRDLAEVDVSHKEYEFSGSIVQHHTLMDETSIPYGITIDFDSLKEPYSASLRDRDSTNQVRIPLNEVAGVVRDLSFGKATWTQVELKYPKFEQEEK